MKKKQMKDTQAAREDAEEEEMKPTPGNVGNLLLTDDTRFLCEKLVQTVIEERKQHKLQMDGMTEELMRAQAENERKDEEISRMRAESERKEAAHAEEISLMRAENFALRKAAATYLHETSGAASRKLTPASPDIPAALRTPEARAMLQKLADGRILDERWQPVNLSNAEKGIVAQYLSAKLDIKNQWRFFAELWGMNPETLRRAAAKALDQRKTLDFQERLKTSMC